MDSVVVSGMLPLEVVSELDVVAVGGGPFIVVDAPESVGVLELVSEPLEDVVSDPLSVSAGPASPSEGTLGPHEVENVATAKKV
jgi:hypothetical protein